MPPRPRRSSSPGSKPAGNCATTSPVTTDPRTSPCSGASPTMSALPGWRRTPGPRSGTSTTRVLRRSPWPCSATSAPGPACGSPPTECPGEKAAAPASDAGAAALGPDGSGDGYGPPACAGARGLHQPLAVGDDRVAAEVDQVAGGGGGVGQVTEAQAGVEVRGLTPGLAAVRRPVQVAGTAGGGEGDHLRMPRWHRDQARVTGVAGVPGQLEGPSAVGRGEDILRAGAGLRETRVGAGQRDVGW